MASYGQYHGATSVVDLLLVPLYSKAIVGRLMEA